MVEDKCPVFQWSDSLERAGLNDLLVTRGMGAGVLVVRARHAMTGVSVALPRYAVIELVTALATYVEETDPLQEAVEEVLLEEFPMWGEDTRAKVRRLLSAKFSERGITVSEDEPPSR